MHPPPGNKGYFGRGAAAGMMRSSIEKICSF